MPKGFIDPKNSITFKVVKTGGKSSHLEPMQPSLNLQRKGFQPDLDFSMVKSDEEEEEKSDDEQVIDQSDFGVYFTDNYDYLQHLKTTDKANIYSNPTKSQKGIEFVDFEDATALNELNSEKQVGSSAPSFEGLDQGLPRTTENDPNVDPSIKEIFVALEDEAYVEDELEDFFDAFNQDSLPDKYSSYAESKLPAIPEEPWMSEFKKYFTI
jgi:Low temperature viability protein